MSDLSHIAESLRPLAVPLDSLVEDAANVRTHDIRNLDAIKASLAQFGQRSPIIVQVRAGGQRVIRAGNGRFLAARELVHEGDTRWTQLAAVLIEESDTAATAFAIADNRTAELAGWDDDALARQLEALQQEDDDIFSATGFDDFDLEVLLHGLDPTPAAEEFEEEEQKKDERLKARMVVTCEMEDEEALRALIKDLVEVNGFEGVQIK